MSNLYPNLSPHELPCDSLTLYRGSYYYRDWQGILYEVKATDNRVIPLQITVFEYPPYDFKITSGGE